MTRHSLHIVFVFLLSACDSSEQQEQILTEAGPPVVQEVPTLLVGKAELEDTAFFVIRTLSDTLKNELTAAMQAGGPVNALRVCNVRASEITEEISREHDVMVSRTSLKYRNPANAPNEWQMKVLEEFEIRVAAGENPLTLFYSNVVDNEFRFMKAIPTGALCLTCHGADISPEVSAELARLYPEDKATGFREGELRGAFVITKNLAE